MNDERRIAYLTLMDVEQNKAYSNLALNHHIAVGRPNSEALVRRLVYGVLENKMYLDFVIGKYLNQPMRKLNFSESNILRLGIYQLAFMNSIPTYAAVAETVNLAKKYIRGREGFINAILRNYLRSGHEIRLPDRNKDESEFLSIKYSYAKWIVDMWIKEYGSAFTEELLAAGNKAPQLTIRPNTLRINKKNLKKRLIENGFEVENGRISNIALRVKGEGLLKTGLYENGMFSVQDESSMVAVDILNPGPGENAIDVCAAPGGKTMFIAERMENMGNVVARDLYKKKIDLLIKEADRLGITIISGGTWDVMITDSTLEETADKVLVDAPCSGFGVVRRKPEIKYKEHTEIRQLPETQKRILEVSSKYVKKGGILLYCTCTINTEENQDVTAEFLKSNTEFIREDSIQLFPNINDTDGFYICRMRRR